jgi:hypothetical protein
MTQQPFDPNSPTTPIEVEVTESVVGQSWPATETVQTPQFTTAPTSSNAIVALVLSICSWVILPFVLGWIFAIVALVFASKAGKEITASGGGVQGTGFVTAAKIVSWINIGLTAAMLVLGLLFLIILVVAGSVT